jgi:hypothetical protein
MKLPLIIVLLVLSAPVQSRPPQKVPIATASLGNLRIEILKVEQTTLVVDSFNGPSSSQVRGRVYLRIRNIGDSRVCSDLLPSMEEYKGSELQYAQELKTGLKYNPRTKSVPPGTESSGYLDFKPSPQLRDYILVLQERNGGQRCGKATKADDAVADGPVARLPLPKTR